MNARRGWIADPPPPPPRDYIPGEEYKWYLMMGAARWIPRKRPPNTTDADSSVDEPGDPHAGGGPPPG